MKSIAKFVVRRRIPVLIALVLLTAILGYEASAIRVDVDAIRSLPADDPDVAFFKEIDAKYGTSRVNIVAMEADDVFTHEALAALRDVTRAVTDVDGVRVVTSLANVPAMRRVGGAVDVKPLVDPKAVPDDPAVLAAMRKSVLADPMMVGNLVSADGRAALIPILIADGIDAQRVGAAIRDAAQKAAPDATLYFAGFAITQDYASRLSAKDMGRLVPFLVVLMLVVLYAGLRTVRGALLPFVSAGLAVVWTIGAMAAAGMTLTMLTSAVPIVVIALGTASAVLVLESYGRQPGGDSGARAEAALAETGGPIVCAGVVTTLGFLAFAFAPQALLREAGFAAAAGAAFAALAALTFVPAMLAALPDRKKVDAKSAAPAVTLARLLAGVGWRAGSSATVLLAATAVVCIVCGLFALRVSSDVNPMSYFPEDSEPRAAEAMMARYFGGTGIFQINFAAEDVREPAILEQMVILEKRLRLVPDVRLPQSAADLIAGLNRTMNDRPGLPDTFEGVANMWFLLEGQAQVALLAESNNTNAIVQARVASGDPAVLRPAFERIRETLDGSVVTDFATVSIADADGATRDALIETLARRIAENVALDVKYHTGKDVESTALAASLAALRSERPTLDESEREILRERFAAYFRGDEADVVIESDEEIDRIAADLAALPELSRDALVAALRASLPAEIVAEDPAGPDYVADSTDAIVETLVSQDRFRRALGLVEKVIGADLSREENAGLRADIESDVWQINHATIALDAKEYESTVGAPAPPEDRISVDVRLNGWAPVSVKTDDDFARMQVRLTLAAAAAILVLLTVALRSVRGGGAAFLPVALALLVEFGAMGLLGVPLDKMTVLVTILAMGTGAGAAVFVARRYASARASGQSPEESRATAAQTAGRAMAIHAIAVAAGFAVLGLSAMTPQRHLGLQIVLVALAAAAGALIVLPAALAALGYGAKKAD